MNRLLEVIAEHHLGVSPLQTRTMRDRTVYPIGVASLHSALVAAYYAGYAANVRATAGSEPDRLPTEQHTLRGANWAYAGARDPRDGQEYVTVTTLPIPEVALLAIPDRDLEACTLIIPAAIRQRRLD